MAKVSIVLCLLFLYLSGLLCMRRMSNNVAKLGLVRNFMSGGQQYPGGVYPGGNDYSLSDKGIVFNAQFRGDPRYPGYGAPQNVAPDLLAAQRNQLLQALEAEEEENKQQQRQKQLLQQQADQNEDLQWEMAILQAQLKQDGSVKWIRGLKELGDLQKQATKETEAYLQEKAGNKQRALIKTVDTNNIEIAGLRFFVTFKESGKESGRHAEAELIHRQENSGVNIPNGTTYLYTYYSPCEECLSLIIRKAKENENHNWVVGFTKWYPYNRPQQENLQKLCDQLREAGMVDNQKLQFVYMGGKKGLGFINIRC